MHRYDIVQLYVLALGASPGSRFCGVKSSDTTKRQLAEAASTAAGAGGATQSMSLEARGPLGDGLVLDQQFTAQHARDELGWTPNGGSPLECLVGAVTGESGRGSVISRPRWAGTSQTIISGLP